MGEDRGVVVEIQIPPARVKDDEAIRDAFKNGRGLLLCSSSPGMEGADENSHEDKGDQALHRLPVRDIECVQRRQQKKSTSPAGYHDAEECGAQPSVPSAHGNSGYK